MVWEGLDKCGRHWGGGKSCFQVPPLHSHQTCQARARSYQATLAQECSVVPRCLQDPGHTLEGGIQGLLNRTLSATPSPQPVHELEPTDCRNLFLSLLCLPSSLFLPPSLDVKTIFSLMWPQCCLVHTNFPPLLPKDPILMGNSPFLTG